MPDTGQEPSLADRLMAAGFELEEDSAHTFRCVVCGKPGDCDGDCDRDPAVHVHFADECWERFRG